MPSKSPNLQSSAKASINADVTERDGLLQTPVAKEAEFIISPRIVELAPLSTSLPPLIRLSNVNDLSDYLSNGGDVNQVVSESEISALADRVWHWKLVLLWLLSLPILIFWSFFISWFILWLSIEGGFSWSRLGFIFTIVFLVGGCIHLFVNRRWAFQEMRRYRLVNKAGTRNWTLLHFICFCRGINAAYERPKDSPGYDSSRGEKSVRLLLQKGADPSKRTIGGCSVVDMLLDQAFPSDLMETLSNDFEMTRVE